MADVDGTGSLGVNLAYASVHIVQLLLDVLLCLIPRPATVVTRSPRQL